MTSPRLSPRKLFVITALSGAGRPLGLEELKSLAREFPATCQLPDRQLLETLEKEGFIKKVCDGSGSEISWELN